MTNSQPAILVLQDGTVFKGTAIGAKGTASGEIAFNTGMTGYQEVFTDPSYFGQLLVMTTAHIGNYGVHKTEVESDQVMISGLITKKFSNGFSRPSGYSSLQELFESQNKVGIADVDTRALVRHIRNKGAMNAIISSENLNIEELKAQLATIPEMNGLELSSKVATTEAYDMFPENSEARFRVALLDFGVKKNIIRCLTDRGCHVRVFPLSATLDDINSFNPDGYMLSNGPGDPSAMPNSISLVKNIVALNRPVFGICLGHQILGLSQGLKTEKMFNGHRGINHPIKNLLTGKGEITSQNHGFVITKESIDAQSEVEVTHVHLNDHTIAGIAMKNKPVFSVQYHPEASAGPHDSRYLFDQFINQLN
ncbi:MAG: glutamine-hydrolyzing carbamoyl-phosphate synthase small subunit [Flavobacteriales bacterium]|jgi:carbamoyl-phosphate synthase small subunit